MSDFGDIADTTPSRGDRPLVALVGRPNVGKSTLFNRLVGKRTAIVEDLPGTTRDRLYGVTDWAGHDFAIVDTGGLEIGAEGQPMPVNTVGFTTGSESRMFLQEIRAQAELAITEAEVIVLLVDGEAGPIPADYDVAELLRRTKKPVVLAVNKADNRRRQQEAVEFYALGLGDPIPISALHGLGTGDLLDAIVGGLPEHAIDDEAEDDSIKIAILGRPNVGKSSLLNKLLGEDRVIVSNVPGTTRDAIDTRIQYGDLEITLIDTAGIRRRGKIEPGVEKYSYLRSVRAINRAEVCLLLVDATEMVTAQDAHIAGYIVEEAKSVVVVVNKWDAVPEKDTHTILAFTDLIRAELKFLDFVPVIFISALTGQRADKVLPLALQVHEERLVRIPTSQLNKLLQDAVAKHPPKGKHQLKFFYATQARTDPPTFVFFVNEPSLVHFTYQRYLENKLREQYGFIGTPIKLFFRGRKEP